MKILLPFLFLIAVVACNGAKVAYDYDTKKDFNTFQTYNYITNLSTNLSDLDQKRLLKATDSLMNLKGFQKTDSPQLLVDFKSDTYETPSNKRIGVGLGNGPINIGGNIPFGAPNQHIKLDMHILDAINNSLIWQAKIDDVQNSRNTPENRTEFFYIMMEKILKNFPPKN